MQRTQTICLVILTTFAVGWVLAATRSVLLPFIIAVFIVIGCRPIVEYLENRWKLPKMLAFGVALGAGIFSMMALAALTWISLLDLSRNIGAYESRFESISEWVTENLIESRLKDEGIALAENGVANPLVPGASATDPKSAASVTSVLPDFNQSPDSPPAPEGNLAAAESAPDPGADQAARPMPPHITSADSHQAINRFVLYVSEAIRSHMLNLTTALTNLMSYVILILIFVFFLLAGSTTADSQLSNGAPEKNRTLQEIEDQIREYLVMKSVISLFTGLLFGLALWLFGVPMALLFGFLAFLLNFIPNIGPLVSSVLPLPLLVLNSDMSPLQAGICFTLCAAVQFISGNVVEPKMMGKNFDVHPAFLLISLMFFGLIWGIIGMFLATPLVSILKITLSKTQMGKPIAELMAGRLDTLPQ